MVSSIAQVPMWIYAVMAALGWNELIAVLRSPIYFTLLLMALAGLYVVWKLNLSGPIISVSKAMGREVHKIADEQLRAHFSQTIPQPAMLAERPVSSGKASEAGFTPRTSSTQPAENIELREFEGGKKKDE
jgi:hypothetical protein